jgi:hypothetical protein
MNVAADDALMSAVVSGVGASGHGPVPVKSPFPPNVPQNQK